MKKLMLFLLVGIFLTTLVSALSMPPVKQGDNITIRQTCGSCSYVNVSIYYPNGTKAISNTGMSEIGDGFWEYNFTKTNTVGRYDYPTCGDISGLHTCSSTEDLPYFEVTPDGNSYDVSDSIVQSLFILFFIGLFIFVYYLRRGVDLEKLNNSIYEKYKNNNYIKLVLSSIGYNLLKNSFVIYYLISFPIIVLLTDLAFIYGMTNLVNLLKVVTIIYSVGVIVVGLIFMSYVQEWLMDLLNKIRDMDWGIQ